MSAVSFSMKSSGSSWRTNSDLSGAASAAKARAVPSGVWSRTELGTRNFSSTPGVFTAMALGEGDRPEHLPYMRAGFVVVAYAPACDVEHHFPEKTIASISTAVPDFRDF